MILYIMCKSYRGMLKFLSSKDTEDVACYCKACKLLAKTVVIEYKGIKDKCKKYTKELH